MHQVGRLDGNGPQKQALLIHDADSACLWAVLDYPTWPLRHARETSILDWPQHSDCFSVEPYLAAAGLGLN